MRLSPWMRPVLLLPPPTGPDPVSHVSEKDRVRAVDEVTIGNRIVRGFFLTDAVRPAHRILREYLTQIT